jgi:ATP/maltotriose-dependent transcriptional regulator MalT
MARSLFLAELGYLLNLSGRYDDALEPLLAGVAEATDYRLGFALPQLMTHVALAEFGRRNFAYAHQALQESTLSEEMYDVYCDLLRRTVRARLLLAEGNFAEARATTAYEPDHIPARTMHGEYVAVRGLVLACCGDDLGALSAAAAATQISRYSEIASLAAVTEGVVAVHRKAEDRNGILIQMLRLITSTGNYGALVAAYRGCPDLVLALAEVGENQPILARVLARSHDQSLARAAGLSTLTPRHLSSSLTKREMEVHELLAQGLSNREIARTLFISEATAKVHVKHIFEKLGVRSRTQAALRWVMNHHDGGGA